MVEWRVAWRALISLGLRTSWLSYPQIQDAGWGVNCIGNVKLATTSLRYFTSNKVIVVILHGQKPVPHPAGLSRTLIASHDRN